MMGYTFGICPGKSLRTIKFGQYLVNLDLILKIKKVQNKVQIKTILFGTKYIIIMCIPVAQKLPYYNKNNTTLL